LNLSAALLETYIPTTFAAFLGAVRLGEPAAEIWFRLEIFIANNLVMITLFFFSYMTYNAFETTVFKQLVDDVFAHVHRLSERFFVNTFAGSIISQINRGRRQIENFEDQILLRLLSTGVVLIGSIGFLALRFPELAFLVAAYVVVLVVISALLVFRLVGPSQSAYADAQDYYTAHLADSISGIATTKAYAQEKREVANFFGVTRQLRQKNYRAYFLSSLAGLAQHVLLIGMLILLFVGGTLSFLRGTTTVEDMAYLALAYTIIRSYGHTIGDNIKNLLTSSYELHAVIRLLREKPDVADAPDAKDIRVFGGAIEFKDVTFCYPGYETPVIENFSLSIEAGERVALVGHSGTGKTTFVRLIQRLYDVQKGCITIDGQDIAACTQESLRSSMAIVPQDPILFHRTLRENIAYAKPDASREEIRDAARKAKIDDFITGLPLGYETLVGERGINLSGGERQRVAIARALLADRPILILDEATSSLDSASERAIQDALHVLIQGRTSIMIAHRLSTILDSDRILVFDEGQLVEMGTHAELIARDDGIYANLFKLQSGGYIAV
jgi:ATP-binding cassette subfamily B protein